MENKQSFGAFICQRRRELGLTQKEFAQRLFVTDSAVSKWERGLAYPDITLLQDICRVLQCSEKELLSASEDTEGRRAEALAKKYLRLAKTYRVTQYLIYGAILLGCAIGNLVGQHTLSWFWIALAGVGMAASLTLLPALVGEGKRRLAALGGFLLCLLALLAVTCVFTRGTWFFAAAAGVLFGFALVFLPFALRTVSLPEYLQNRKALVYVCACLLLLILIFAVVCIQSRAGWFLDAALWTVFGVGVVLLPFLVREVPLPEPLARHKAFVYLAFETILLLVGLTWSARGLSTFPLPDLPIALVCLALPWGWLGILRYLPIGRWFRAGCAFWWAGLWLWLAPWDFDRVIIASGTEIGEPYNFRLPVDFTQWHDPAVVSANTYVLCILGLLLVGAVCAAVGVYRGKK